MNPTVCKYRNMKKQGIQRMSLFLIEYYAIVEGFDFYQTMIRAMLICAIASSE